MDSLSTIQSKVSTLEDAVDRISEDITSGGRYSDSAPKFLKRNPTIPSPRLSTCTPRSSVDRKSPLQQPLRKSDSWEEGSWMMDSRAKASRNPVKKGISQKGISGVGIRNHGGRNGIGDSGFGNSSSVRHGVCETVKGYLLQGDLDSAYVEALNCGDEMVLVDLLDKTGPVLESLSNRTANDLLGTLALFLSEQQFMSSIIPWLQQAVDLSSGHGPNHLVLTAKARRQFLGAIQEAVNMEFPNPMERRSITQLVSRLHQVWGKC